MNFNFTSNFNERYKHNILVIEKTIHMCIYTLRKYKLKKRSSDLFTSDTHRKLPYTQYVK